MLSLRSERDTRIILEPHPAFSLSQHEASVQTFEFGSGILLNVSHTPLCCACAARGPQGF